MTLDLTISGAALWAAGPRSAADAHIDPNRSRRLDPLSLAAVCAAWEAAREARLDLASGRVDGSIGVAFGTAYGCQETELRYAEKLVTAGARFTNPIDFPDSIDGAPAAHVALELGLGGPSVTHADGRLAGEHAVLHAALALANGRARAMLVGSGDVLTPPALGLPPSCGAGFDSAPGAAFLVLEPPGAAQARGAAPLARLVGIGLGGTPGTPCGRFPASPVGVTVAIGRALAQAGIDPSAPHRVVAGGARAGGVAALVTDVLPLLVAGDVRVIVHHATAPGGASVALVLTTP